MIEHLESGDESAIYSVYKTSRFAENSSPETTVHETTNSTKSEMASRRTQTVPGSYFLKAKGIPRRNYEVCFNKFTPIHPWGPLTLKISRLCHVTHKKEAQSIRHTNRFIPKRKLGKSVNDCNPGKSYRATLSEQMASDEQATGGLGSTEGVFKYNQIFTHKEVFPGFYSWWGLYVEKPIPELQECDSSQLPNYLQDPPDSIYGTTAFLIPFDEILESYASSRSCSLHDLRLRVGGTMRYKHEIAYVIIVCICTDDLSRYDLITSSDAPDLLDVEGFINGEGRIVDKTHFPLFNTCYYISSESYETLSFAFYFPEKQNFICPMDKIHVKENVKHTGCIHNVEMHQYYDREECKFTSFPICPDKITPEHTRKHEAALYWSQQ